MTYTITMTLLFALAWRIRGQDIINTELSAKLCGSLVAFAGFLMLYPPQGDVRYHLVLAVLFYLSTIKGWPDGYSFERPYKEWPKILFGFAIRGLWFVPMFAFDYWLQFKFTVDPIQLAQMLLLCLMGLPYALAKLLRLPHHTVLAEYAVGLMIWGVLVL